MYGLVKILRCFSNKILWDFFKNGCDGEFTSVPESEYSGAITVFPILLKIKYIFQNPHRSQSM